MLKRLRSLALAAVPAVALLAASAPAEAQSDVLLRLRSGSPLGDRFRVDSAGGFVAMGDLGIGIIPFSGEGYRTMWYPFKAAFRSGYADVTGEWDDANVGFFSWAGGYTTKASGIYSFAFGDGAQATAQLAWASGSNTEAIGTASWAGGVQAKARNLTSFAWGNNSWAGNSWRGATNVQGGATAIGYRVTADADWSTAMGYRASTAGQVGSFVWGGTLAGASAATDSIRSTAAGQATWRVPGGFRIFTNTAATVGVQVSAGGSSWSVLSDRSRKEQFLDVDGEEVLGRIRALPVSTWRYIDEEDRSVRHIGPMAQDWHRAFGLSGDSTTINMSDLDGVNLAGVRALEARTAQQAAEIRALRENEAAMRAELAELRALVRSLAAARATP